jgi:hypothetical protein
VEEGLLDNNITAVFYLEDRRLKYSIYKSCVPVLILYLHRIIILLFVVVV